MESVSERDASLCGTSSVDLPEGLQAKQPQGETLPEVAYSHPPGRMYPMDSKPVGLPLLFESFPASQNAGTARYYTMRSVYRGKDEERKRALELKRRKEPVEDDKQMVDFKLPEITLADAPPVVPANKRMPDLSLRYIEIYKNQLKMKGLDFEEIHRRNRNKAEREMRAKRETKKKRRAKLKSLSVSDLSNYQSNVTSVRTRLQVLEEFRDDLRSTHNKDDDSAYNSVVDEQDDNQMERQLLDMVRDYQDTPGQKSKLARCGRKLGNVVSSQRLNQLLRSENPLRMENFYNVYP